MAERLVFVEEVLQRTGYKAYSTIYRLMKAGKFPKARKRGVRVCWLESEVDEWCRGQPLIASEK